MLQGSEFVSVAIRTMYPGFPAWAAPVTVYFRRVADGWQPVGLERGPLEVGATHASPLPDPGRHWELDKVPAVGDPAHMVQFGTGDRESAREGQRRVALQRRVATCRVVVGLEVGELPFKVTPIPEQHIVEKLSSHRPDQALYEWM